MVGFDATADMLAAAQRKAAAAGLGSVQFQRAVLGDAPLPASTESFDLVTCSLMLCHVADVHAAVADCVRLLRPGGHIVLSDFHPAAIDFGWKVAVVTPDEWLNMPTHAHGREGYLRAVTDAGCEVVTVEDISVDGAPYGDTAKDVVQARGVPPLCLVVVGRTVPN